VERVEHAGGYKQDRRWQFVPFAGFGAAMSSVKETKNYEVALAAGLINKVRISDALDANLEFRGMLVNQGFDGVVGGKPIEGMGSVTVGLSYKFNKRGFDKPQTVAPADYTPYNDRIKALEGELVAANEKAARVARELEAARGATAGKSVEIVLPQTAVFFNIGSAELSEKELVNIGYLAAAINKMPAGRKLKLIGNADSATGSDKRNMELSEQRARAVHKALVAAGVDPARLEVVANGSSKEPFEKGKPALNRVLIAE
jgi:outer membrane protein OmpA-like peptidoglycan-associated protein